MRFVRFIPAVLVLVFSGSSLALEWSEYVNMEERFAVNFPAAPAMEEGSFRSQSGAVLPTRIFTAVNGSSTYSVTVVDYSGVDSAEYDGAMDHAVEMIRQRGEITAENDAHYEGMPTRMIQMTNPDSTRSFLAVTLPPTVSHLERLYIVEGRAPASAPPPGLFQQSLSFRDEDGVRLRYGTDVDGNKFRIIGDTCGFPYTRRGERGVVLCDY